MRFPPAWLALACLLPGCLGDLPELSSHDDARACSAQLHADWVEPGLHAALLDAEAEGVTRSDVVPPRPFIPNATFEARWGRVGLVEVAYRPSLGGSGLTEATIAQTPWGGEGVLQLGVSVDAARSVEDGARLADALLARLDLPEEERERLVMRVREEWTPSPPSVGNHVAVVAFEADLDWVRVPALVLRNGTWEESAFGEMRRMSEGPWSLTVKVGGQRVVSDESESRVQMDVAPDDRVRAYVDLLPGEGEPAAFARVNATLARLGLPPATFAGYEGASAMC